VTGLKSALTGCSGSLIQVCFLIFGSDWAMLWPGGVDFTLIPATSHHPVALWELIGLLVSALVDLFIIAGIIL
jgi:hypothetical protein